MLKQWPMLDIIRSDRHQVQAQGDKVKSHFIQSARDNIADHHDLCHSEFTAERVEFIDTLPAHNKNVFPIAERVEGGVRGPNPTESESKAANEWPASALRSGGRNAPVYLYQIVSLGK